MKPKISQRDSSDEEINAAVAEYVAGFKQQVVFGWGKQPVWTDNGKLLSVTNFTSEGDGYCDQWKPNYVDDANAVFQLLDSREWTITKDKNPRTFEWQYNVFCTQPLAIGIAPTFQLAACFALLKLNGVTVTD
jgi:hypothetical protein